MVKPTLSLATISVRLYLLLIAKGMEVWNRQLDIYGRVKREIKASSLGDDVRPFIPFLYQEQYYDFETNLTYNRFRYYSPETGAYISQDPIGLAGGTNLYSYVHDSNTWIDVLGLYPTWNSETNQWTNSETGEVISRPTDLVKPNPDEAFFWSGRTEGEGGEKRAAEIASSRGGTTLEMLIEKNNIKMPEWDASNPIHVAEWGAMSEAYAKNASGKVYAVIGNELREGNV